MKCQSVMMLTYCQVGVNSTFVAEKCMEHRNAHILNKPSYPGFPGNCNESCDTYSILLNRTGARDSENASLTLSDLASLFTQDEERDEEQGVTGSFLFYEPTDALSPD